MPKREMDLPVGDSIRIQGVSAQGTPFAIEIGNGLDGRYTFGLLNVRIRHESSAPHLPVLVSDVWPSGDTLMVRARSGKAKVG